MKIFNFMVATLIMLISMSAYSQAKPKLPVINSLITLLDPENLDTVRVDLTNSTTPRGTKITKTEINFGDNYISTTLTEIHKYSSPGTYQIITTIWNDLNLSAQQTKSIYVNADLKVSGSIGSPIFNKPNLVSGTKYPFNATSAQAQKLYLLTLNHSRTTNALLEALSNLLTSLGLQTTLNTFSAGVSFNNMNLFAPGEITIDTTQAQKLVYLNLTNSISTTFTSPNFNQIGLDISEVQLIRDTTPPVITFDLPSNSITNSSFTHFFTVVDDSSVTNLFSNNGNLGQSTDYQVGVFLKEGINNLKLTSTDSFGNTSAFNVNNITLDSIPPKLISIVPSSGTTLYTNKLPLSSKLKIVFNEKLSSLLINGNTAVLSGDLTSANFDLVNSTPGPTQVNLTATDLAGNQVSFSSNFNIIYSTTLPVITLGLTDKTLTNNNSKVLPVSVQSTIPFTAKVNVNGVEIAGSSEVNFNQILQNLVEGTNQISVTAVDAAGNVAVPVNISLILDTVAPVLTYSNINNGKTFYTNHFPLSIPIQASFSEAISSVQINPGITVLNGPNSISGSLETSQIGTNNYSITATDLAGNSATFNQNFNVQYSTALPILTINPEVIELLTNKISIPVSGTSNQPLTNITLNGAPIQLSTDGKTFYGTFNAPKDGRYELTFSGTDFYGNVGTATTHVRIIVDLPDPLENPKPPTLDPGPTGSHQINFGPLYTPDICAALDGIFKGSDEFYATLDRVVKTDSTQYTKDFPSGYDPNVPDTGAVKNFIGDIDEKLNYVKAGYLVMCKGFNILPGLLNGDLPTDPSIDPSVNPPGNTKGTECLRDRELFHKIMGEYPEPMIISEIPLIPLAVQTFLNRRYNICTGLDTSGLGCKDFIELIPLLANFEMPALGEALGSPLGQLVMEEVLCKEICDRAGAKDTPICTGIELPNVKLPIPPTIISFTPPLIPGIPIGPGDWGHTGNWPDLGGHGCGGWFSHCGSDGPDFNHFICSAFPSLWLCPGTSDPSTISFWNDVIIDPNIDCNTNVYFADIFNSSLNPNLSPTSVFSSFMAKCIPSDVPGIPKVAPPVITVMTPAENQLVETATVRVSGHVNGNSTLVRVQGHDVKTVFGFDGVFFDVIIPVPANLTVKVEAVDGWGNVAVPVEIHLTAPNAGITKISNEPEHECFIKNGSAFCIGNNDYGQLGEGTLVRKNTPQQVIGLTSGVTDISVAHAGSCAVQNGDVYCWGQSVLTTHPELPAGVSVPQKVQGLGPAKSVANGQGFACSLLLDNSVKCWGSLSDYDSSNNPVGNLGDGSTKLSFLPINVISDVKSLSVKRSHVCVSLNTGGVSCWGVRYNVELPVPTKVDGLTEVVSDISISYSRGCAIVGSAVKCWGQLIDAEYTNVATTEKDFGPDSKLTGIALSFTMPESCVINNGLVSCWWHSNDGYYTPFDQTPLVQSIAVSNGSFYLIKNGELYHWSSGDYTLIKYDY